LWGLIALASLCGRLDLAGADPADFVFPEEEGVLVLSQDNFDKAVKLYTFLLVEFYAPWCGHCKELAPEYAKAAQAVKESGIYLAKVDGTVEKDLSAKYGVKGYPTLKFFKEGKPIDYSGGRTGDDIIQWVTKKSGPPFTSLGNVEAAQTALEKNEIAVFGFFKDWESDACKTYLELTAEIDNIAFYLVNTDVIFKEYKVTGDSIVLFKKFDEGRIDLTTDLTKQSIKEFVTVQSLPLVIEFSQETAQKVFGGDIKTHLLFFASKKSEKFESVKDIFKTVGQEFRGKLLIVYINIDETNHDRILDYFNLNATDCPTFRYVTFTPETTKYKPESSDKMTVAGLTRFVKEIQDGKRKPHLRTEEIPSDWDAKTVKVLVGKNFDQVAKDPAKAVFVEFYAPWCGHCKQIEPVWDELGEKYEDSNDIIIAKMDATANELQDVKIPNYPTFKYYPKGSSEVIDFDGDRTLEGFTRFLDSGGKDQTKTPPVELKKETAEETEKKPAADDKKKEEL